MLLDLFLFLTKVTNGDHGDIDIFLTCEPEGARVILATIYDHVRSLHRQRAGAAQSRLLVTRSKRAVTFFPVSEEVRGTAAIQVILTVYENVQQLLVGLDCDSSCFAYEPASDKVWTTQRGFRALQYACNIGDNARGSSFFIESNPARVVSPRER